MAAAKIDPQLGQRHRCRAIHYYICSYIPKQNLGYPRKVSNILA